MCDNKKYCTQLALMLETESGRNNTSAARVAKLCQFNYYKFNTCIGVDTLHRKFISFLLFVIHTLYNLFQQILQINYNSRRQKFCFIESCVHVGPAWWSTSESETVRPCYYRGTAWRRDANRYLGQYKSIPVRPAPRPDVVIAAFVGRL